MSLIEKKVGDLDTLDFCGVGTRVLFLHGGPGCYRYMEPLCKQLSAYCNPVYYEQRGSRQTLDGIGISEHIDDLQQITRYYSKESKPILVGHSWGAMLAVLFAGRFSHLLQKVVLVGCGPLNQTQGSEFQEVLCQRFGQRQAYFDALWDSVEKEQDPERQQQNANQYLKEMMPIYQNETNPESMVDSLHWDFRASYKTICESDEWVSTDQYEKALRTIQVPLTAIQGSYDPVSPESLFPLIRMHLPQAKTVTLDQAGHYPWAGRQGEAFIELLRTEL